MRTALALLPILALTGCAGTGPCGSSGESAVSVIRHFTFLREEPEGVSEGFDLDGRVSDDTDPRGCYVPDLTSPEGQGGIDNSLSALLPALEAIGQGEAIEPLVQAAINSGELLIMFELEGLDDLSDDDCVSLNILRGAGVPSIGTDDRLLPGQTFDRNTALSSARIESVPVVDGTIVASPFDFGLPLNIFDESLYLTLLDAVIEMHLDADGSAWGMMSGGVSVAEIQENVAGLDGIGASIPGLVDQVLSTNADLAPNGSGGCDRISVAFAFEAVSAYLFEADAE